MEGAVEEPFRQVVERREEAGLPTPSHSTVHSLARKLGEMVAREQEEQRRALFEDWEGLPREKKRAEHKSRGRLPRCSSHVPRAK